MVTVAEPVPLLLERDAEQTRLSALLEQARAGGGAVVTISGPAGIGKTQLLAAVHRLAADRGFRSLRARGRELEADMAFSVVRQLLEQPVLSASASERRRLLAGPGLGLELIRPARKDETPRPFPNWLRQRVEAIIWTLKNQLGLERHGGRVPARLWARVVQRLLARNATIWHNWLISAPVKRSLIAYDHCLPAPAPGPRHGNMGRVTEVYLEAGKRRVFACAPRWPGWCRPGRDEEVALAALAAAAPRYAEVCARAGFPFDPVEVTASFEVLERVTGSATTDFGALDVAPALDGEPMAAQEPERLATLIQTAWDLFERTAAVAPPVLRKGPRGGGRDRDQIVAHVRETEVLHARMLGLSERPFPPQDVAAAERVRAGILAEIRAGAAARPPKELARSRRPARFVARRTAWHALDHAWEILDKQEP